MSDFVYFELDLNPEPWAVGPVVVGRKANKMYGNIGRNQQLFAYQEAVREELENLDAKKHWIDKSKIELAFYFWRNRAEYTTPQSRGHRKHEADLTNLQKATEDALQGVLFKNDKDVARVTSTMVAQGPEVEGRIVIGVRRMDPDELNINFDEIFDAEF